MTASCHAYPAAGESYAELAARPAAWTCGNSNWSADHARGVLRFDLGASGVVPDRFVTRLARIESVQLGIERIDGTIAWRRLGMDDFKSYGPMQMATSLPDRGTAARAIVVELVAPTLRGQLSMATLQSGDGFGYSADELYLAALCGLLIAPLLFNLAFYRVLREKFLLWHALAVGCLLAQIIVSSGLVRALGGLPVGLVSYLVVTTFCAGAAAAVMLALHFIEIDKLDDRHRNALRLTATWIMLNGAIFVVSVDALQQLAVRIYYLAWLPVLVTITWAMATAVQRKSRAVWFQIVAWAPMVVIALVRILASTGDLGESVMHYRAQDMAIAIEVIVISVGILDRLVGMRRDIDRYRRRANRLEELAERDPLTGLLNRRAIEPRFTELREEGFSTFAVIDLDMFKDINDRFGHDVGDKVLQSVARALEESDDMLSMRLGGEEFVIILRGRNSLQRAEWCRQAITTRVAAEVEGLDRLVSASMGLLEIPSHVMPDATFSAIYSRADGLLYQAKRGGRNRMVSERLSTFDKHLKRKPIKAAA